MNLQQNFQQLPSSPQELIISDYTLQAYETNQSGNEDNINFDFLLIYHIPKTSICSLDNISEPFLEIPDLKLDMQNAKQDNDTTVIIFDLMKNLPTPVI